MGLFFRLAEKIRSITGNNWTFSRTSGSLESRQSGSSGGMSTTELLIRLELVMGQGSKLPLMRYSTEMAKLSHPLQLYIFSKASEFSDLSYPHAGEFLEVASTALLQMEQKQYERWLSAITQLLHSGEMLLASERIQNYSEYTNAGHDNTAYLSDITYTLEKLIFSIHKKELPILESQMSGENDLISYTNNEELYLPVCISRFDNHEDNYRLYKVLTFQLLGQIHCHSEKALGALNEGIRYHGEAYLALFSTIETLRIDDYIKNQFPGLWRDIELMHQQAGIDYPSDMFDAISTASVQGSLHLTSSLLESTYVLPELIYQSTFKLEMMAHVQALTKSRVAPLILNPTHDVDEKLLDTTGDPRRADRGYLRSVDNKKGDSILTSPPPGWIPDSNAVDQDEQHTTRHLEKGVYYYKEWDTSLQKYRKDWCRLKEIIEDQPIDDMEVEHTEAMRHAEHRIRKTFDLLINDQKFMRAQSDGDEIDIDAWVSARSGKSKDTDDYQNLYIRNNTNSRDVAIMFAVDLSGSTAGWKNTMIRQSTWLLCKTLARLGDQYAVYGFSGSGRSNCQIYPVKSFSEGYTKTVKSRIFSMKPQQYTRMGVAIRHLSMLLGKTTAKTRILFVLTDGRPDDLDSYRGQYGVEDTRLALNEAKALSLKPFVLTFDKEGMDYLPYMLGSNRYQLITDISQLPIQISTIYKQLTT
jgi:nitric oxide reductase NorD protein